MSTVEATRRTLEKGVGFFVEDLTLYSEDKSLSDAEHEDIAQYAKGFEECSYSLEELRDMDDAELVSAAYWCMAEYARGQM
jgi:hypothetical protein